MGNHPKKSLSFIILLLILFIGLIGMIAMFYWINISVRNVFGSPSPNMTFSQRVIYPIELFINQDKLLNPHSKVEKSQTFEIRHGESVSMVCVRLKQAGLIVDVELMQIYLVYTGLDRQLQSGTFDLAPSMSPIQIAEAFLDATSKDVVISILPGWRIEEVAANVARSGLSITEEVFIAAAYSPANEYVSFLPVDDVLSLEGFLYPGNYFIPREAGLGIVFEQILLAFNQNVDATLMDGFKRQGLTLYDAVIMASIVEKEAVMDEEKPLIASVFYNRLAQGMRLETDPTVQYSLGFNEELNTWWKAPLSLTDLAVVSPYNTYQVFGLPPTPICNPDLISLRAVAFPADTPYYFFRASCDGSGRHQFAITFEEHLNNRCD